MCFHLLFRDCSVGVAAVQVSAHLLDSPTCILLMYVCWFKVGVNVLQGLSWLNLTVTIFVNRAKKLL